MSIRAMRPSKCRLAGLGVVLAACLGVAQAAGAAPVTRVYVLVVPPPQNVAFSDGIKTWEKCLRDNGDKQAVIAYGAETGDLDRYLFLQEYGAWAAMDAHDPSDKTCAPVFRGAVFPHLTRGFSEVAELNAKDSYMPGGDADPPPMMWVDAFRIKRGQTQAFHDAVAKFTAAAAKTHWPQHFAGYDINGSGQGGEDFVVVWPNKSWADIGQEPKPSVKQLMESVYGKRAAAANHKKFLATFAEEWSDVWTYDKELSFTPGK